MGNDEIRQKLEDLELINSINFAINRGDSLNKIIELVSTKTKKLFSSFGATVYLLSEDKKYLVIQRLNLPSAVKKRIESLIKSEITMVKIPLREGSHYYKTLKAKKLKIINDTVEIKELIQEFVETIPENQKVMRVMIKKLIPKICKVLGICSVMIAPLVTNSKVLGLMDISGRKPFENFDLERISSISNQLAIAINRKQTEDKIRLIFEGIKTNKNRFKELFEHMSSGVAVYEAVNGRNDFIFKDFNKAAEKIDKIRKKDILGKSVLEVFPGIKNFGLFDVFKRVYRTGKPEKYPISFYKDRRITG
ncbi:MAG: GAF domain-containing protein [Actinobacteria bacterium]|nr:GAF domain-containing protein [Actinomycetota bacterium]